MQITRIGKSNAESFSMYLDNLPTSPYSCALGLIEDDRAIGAGVFRGEGNYCVIEHLLVDEEYRRKGAANYLLQDVERVMKKHQLDSIISWYADTDGSLTELFRSRGYIVGEGDPVYSFRIGDAIDAASSKLPVYNSLKSNVLPIKKLKYAQIRAVIDGAANLGFDESLFDEGSYDKDISLVYMDKEKPVGALLVKRMDSDYNISLFYSSLGISNGGIALLLSFFALIEDEVRLRSKAYFVLTNDELAQKIGRLLRGKADFKKEYINKSAMLNFEYDNEPAA